MEPPEAHPCSADWSPRISFSYGFVTKQRISSPAKHSPIHDSDFEFSSFDIGPDLTPKWCMLSADELFSDGKLRLVEGSSGFGMTESEWREEGGISICRDNVDDICYGEAENFDAFERKLPTIRARKVGKEVADDGSVSRRSEDGPNPADALRSFTNRGDLISAFRKQEKERLPASREDTYSAQMLGTCENAGECTLPTSREDAVPLQRCKDAANREAVQKIEMGTKGSKRRSPTSREDLMPAYKPENGSKASKLRAPTSREELLLACGRSHNKATMEASIGKARESTNRECLKSPGMVAVKCDETRTPVRWRGEALSSSKRNKEDEHASQLRRLSRNPRSASMTMGSFSQLANRTCVSLDNSRCPSPSRSFSLPATTPTSPTASRPFSVVSASSSSSSGYRNRIKDFFQLKSKQAPKLETEISPTSCSRMPLSPSSFLPFFRRKAESGTASDSTRSLPQQAQEKPCASKQNLSYSGESKEQKIIATTSQGQVSSLHKDLDNASVKLAHIAITDPEQNAFINLSSSDPLTPSVVDKSGHNANAKPATGSGQRIRHSYSLPHEKLVLGKDGQIVLGINENLWKEASINVKSNMILRDIHAKQSNHKGSTRGNMVSSGGRSLGRHHNKGLERPLPYTSSVRVTPVLNVPSCITPSLRKAKSSSSKHNSFSFSRIFLRGKALAGSGSGSGSGSTPIAPTCEGR
ncbi:hypothetical protein GOP47_0015996 [Adiantum capillus-veneris]|uniref:Uncharacterized protein n=1 Tax=Adiantum capillus-veneris TaxID=13818 RepID=A0A9D4UKU1_ADICA|nr:hypothetical protein GOP47_0015996 [Adiantum capillus-veneris]